MVLKRFIARALQADGWEVAGVSTGAEARDRCRSERFDIALVDVNLSAEDGIEIARDLKNRHPGVRVAITSGDRTNEKRGAEAGIHDFLLKPFGPDDLTAFLSRLSSTV